MNAIILAAGKGERLLPLTTTIPKPLLYINGERIIERQIRFLREANVDSIIIVVGHLAKEFFYLKDKFQHIEIVVNEQYNTTNNFYSLFLVKNRLKNTWIIEGDIYLIKNIFIQHHKSVYYTSLKRIVEYEWFFAFDNVTGRIQTIHVADKRIYPELFTEKYQILTGISYWLQDSSLHITAIFDRLSSDNSLFKRYCNSYWDQLIADHFANFELYVHHVSADDWFELDSIADLQNLISLLENNPNESKSHYK